MVNMDVVNTRKKWIWYIVVFVLIIGALIYGLKLYLPGNRVLSSNIIDAIPQDAAIIIKTEDFNNVLADFKENLFWNEIKNFEEANHLDNQFRYFDSLRFVHEPIEKLFNNRTYISFHLLGLEKIKPIFYFSMNRISSGQIKKTIDELCGRFGTITERKYESYTVYDALLLNGSEKFSFSFYGNYLVISSSSILLENSIRQLNSGYSIESQKGFNKVSATAGNNSLLNLYINYDAVSKIFPLAFNNKFASNLRSKGKFAEWTELDLTLKKNLLLLSGFTFTSDSTNNIENILMGQDPRKMNLHSITPSSCNSFLSFQISDKELFKSNYLKYLTKNGSINRYNNTLEGYNRKYKVDFGKLFYEIFEDEIGMVKCNINSGRNVEEEFFIIKTKGESVVKEQFVEILKNWAKTEGKHYKEYILKYTIDEGSSYNIFRFPEPSIVKDIFGIFFSFDDACYFSFVNNYLVFSGSSSSMGKFIYANVLNKTLDKTLEYNDFNEYVNSRSNLYYYIKIPRSDGTVNEYMNDPIKTMFTKNHQSFEKINALSLQISGSDEMLYNNITLNYVELAYDNPVTEWETLLDTIIDFKPVFVVNHYTKEYEIFVQDLKNNIYLINNSGRIVWKEKIDGAINSEVFQVDYYKNGKLQLLFSTEKAIHLIDRNGNYVERYPVKLRANATAGINLFDYDKNRDYRMFIPCNDKKVYAYSLDGNLITGWNFDKSDHNVVNPIKHFKVGSKDYIVFADKYKVYILDRRGNTRIKLKDQIEKSVNNDIFLDEHSKPKFVLTDNTGKVNMIYMDGSVEKKDLGNFSENHFFELNDVDADDQDDFIYLDDSQLTVYNWNKKKIFSLNFKNDIGHKPSYYYFSRDDRKLGVVDETDEEIFLINNSGKYYKGFPLIGNSPFTIGILKNNYGSFNLIVGGKNNYLYNYAIN